MSRRAWILVGLVAAVVVGGLAAAYLSGVIIVGDPFSGVWNMQGRPLDTGALIKHTDDGYVFTALVGGKAVGWHPLRRDRRTLIGEWDAERYTFEYQPWTGHLVSIYRSRGGREIGPLVLKKATGDTSLAPQTD